MLCAAMRSSATCNQRRLLLASLRASYPDAQHLQLSSQHPHRRLASKSTRNARIEPALAAEEDTSGGVKIRRYTSRNVVTTQGTNGAGSSSNVAFRSLDLKPDESDIPERSEAPESSTLRMYHTPDLEAPFTKKATKNIYSDGLPQDPAETMPEMARYKSKRGTEAATERFLGIRRNTKHEMVNKALAQAQAIYRQRKSEQGLDAWANSIDSGTVPSFEVGEDTTMKKPLDKASKAGSGLEKVVWQPGDVKAQQFDILDSIGSNFKTTKANSEDTKGASEVDWDRLPLSPLMHQRLIDARQRFHGIKRAPHEASDYDMAKGAQFLRDYVGCMLASPIRTCRLTNARLPKDFLLTMQAIQHPETRQVWELPKRLNPQGQAVEILAEAETSTSRAANQAESHLNSSWPSNPDQDLQKETGAITMTTISEPPSPIDEKENSTDVVIHNNIGSYIISTHAAIDWMSKLQRKRYLRTIPLRWRLKLGNTLINQIHWRPDMPLFINSLMQRQIIDKLRILKPALEESEDEVIQPCAGIDHTNKEEFRILPDLQEGVIIYLGHSEQSTLPNSFTSTIKAIAERQTTKTVVRNDLFNAPQGSKAYHHTVRIYAEDKANLIVYDMTRLLEPKFIQALRAAGYDQTAYFITATQESEPLRMRLWWLAHYIG